MHGVDVPGAGEVAGTVWGEGRGHGGSSCGGGLSSGRGYYCDVQLLSTVPEVVELSSNSSVQISDHEPNCRPNPAGSTTTSSAPGSRWVFSTRLLWEELERDLQRDAGMPFSYYDILVMLSESPGRRLADERTRRLDPVVAQPALPRGDPARGARLGAPRDVPDDRRGQHAVLTDEGFAALEAAAPDHVESVRSHLFDVLSPEQLAQLREISDTLLDHLLPLVAARGDGRPEHFGGSGPDSGVIPADVRYLSVSRSATERRRTRFSVQSGRRRVGVACGRGPCRSFAGSARVDQPFTNRGSGDGRPRGQGCSQSSAAGAASAAASRWGSPPRARTCWWPTSIPRARRGARRDRSRRRPGRCCAVDATDADVARGAGADRGRRGRQGARARRTVGVVADTPLDVGDRSRVGVVHRVPPHDRGAQRSTRSCPASGRTVRAAHIVLTSSMAGLLALSPTMTGGVNTGLYTVMKHTLVGYSEMLRHELAPEAIGVSVLCPGLGGEQPRLDVGQAPARPLRRGVATIPGWRPDARRRDAERGGRARSSCGRSGRTARTSSPTRRPRPMVEARQRAGDRRLRRSSAEGRERPTSAGRSRRRPPSPRVGDGHYDAADRRRAGTSRATPTAAICSRSRPAR